MSAERIAHEWDEDGCCEHCGFDGAEEYHLRVTSVREDEREPAPDYARYCDERARKAQIKRNGGIK